ncbi:hypothetical protein [Halocynthiibacter namhaensis]|uniref:hypothetical protein n=1 Tax=Halocynthiibacter namhaensis TaxID=1290553 RepID=UPI00069228AD|nr:hypothetical protein [Halocynthiibacter namhaensis]
MTKQLVLFGNGLGRAIDNDFYPLERAMKAAWDDTTVLDTVQKNLICGCIEDELIEGDLVGPTEEEQLTDLQRVLTACDLVSEFEAKLNTGETWLTEHGKAFPKAIRRYFHDVASRFHDPEKQLPDDFANSLRDFVRSKRPHIATLNYDDLLYESFTETDIFNKHMLRDGFFKKFNFSLHEYHYSSNEGWFLHLHGSPLFINVQGTPCKVKRCNLAFHQGTDSNHLVLTNATSKPSVIQNSVVLKRYWEKFAEIISQGVDITLFGYGGGDLHLNDLISKSGDNVSLRIVCRDSGDLPAELDTLWHGRFNGKDPKKINIIRNENILDFRDW